MLQIIMRALRFPLGYLNSSEKVKRMHLLWCKENFYWVYTQKQIAIKKVISLQKYEKKHYKTHMYVVFQIK